MAETGPTVSSDDPALTRPDGFRVDPQPWGRLTWMVSGAQGSSERLTVGRAHIDPGRSNPRHLHPNCDEVLYVLRGRIEHTIDDRRFRMIAGDVVSIPRGATHNATNIGEDTAELLIVFDTAHRDVVGE